MGSDRKYMMEIKEKRTDRKGTCNFTYCLFMIPVIVYLLIWKAFPLIYTGYLSLTKYNPLKRQFLEFCGLDNFISIFSDSSFFMALGRTMYFMAAATAIELILGIIVALLIDVGIKGEKIFRVVFLMPMVITPAVVGTIWYILFHDKLGPISYLCKLIGLHSHLLSRWKVGGASPFSRGNTAFLKNAEDFLKFLQKIF